MLTVRDGIPAFARRLAAGDELTIVAFGTSMTLFGQYWQRLPAALATAYPASRAHVVNRGLRGFTTLWGAFRVRDDVVPERPDLLIVEFAHNDVTPDAVAETGRALDGIIAQLRAAAPECELLFVYLALPGAAAAGPTPAMRAYEATAAYYGIASIDLATVAERAVAAGTVSWSGDSAPALTSDGVHHAPLAAEVLGEPFARAFLELIAASPNVAPVERRPVRDLFFATAYREPAPRYLGGGEWATGVPHDHAARNAEAYGADVAQALAVGAMLRLHVDGSLVHVWAAGNGTLSIAVAGHARPYRAAVTSGTQWSFVTLVPPLAPGHHVIEVTVTALPLVAGDVYVCGGRASGE